MPKAYVSATSKDLAIHRRVVSDVLRRFGYEDVAMEYYVAEDTRAVDKCLADVTACDIYVGIFAWRYGHQPDGTLSITEMEYRHAVKKKKPRLLFVIDDAASWPAGFMDVDRTKVLAFHEAVRNDRLGGTFSTPDSLAAALSAALETRTRVPAKSAQFDLATYYAFVRSRYGVLDLDALTDPKRDEMARMALQSVFVEQDVKEEPPPLDLPKELWQLLAARSEIRPEDLPEGLTSEEIAAYASKPSQPLFDALTTPDNRCSVVLGDPGSGKSTLLRYVLVGLAETPVAERLAPFAGRVPVLIDLRAYAATRQKHHVATFAEHFDRVAKESDNPLTGAAFEDCLERGAVVMFDGVDEIFDPAEQDVITKQIASFAEKHASARVIVTSRIIGYPKVLRTAGFRHFTLQDLREEQVTAFISQWYALTLANPDDVPSRVNRIRDSFKASPSIRQLAGNPMLLTIMAIIGKHQELPRERWKLYDHAASVLVQHWDVKKHLATSRPGEEWLIEDDKKELLCRLAFAMQRGKGGLSGNYIHARELQEEFESYLKERGLTPREALTTAREMISQFHKRNFILSLFGSNLYGFVHRAFLEFFCARAIVEMFQTTRELPIEKLKTEIFGAHCGEKAWHEVLRLICGMIGEEFAAELIEDLRLRGNFAVAIGCLSELRRIERAADVATRLMRDVLFWLAEIELDDTENWKAAAAAIRAADGVGPRWPNREILPQLVREMQVTQKSTTLAADFVALIGTGMPELRTFLFDLLSQAAPVVKHVPRMLVKGWSDDETILRVIQEAEARRDTNLQYYVADVLLDYLDRENVAEFVIRTAAAGSYGIQLAVIRLLADDRRAIPALLAYLELNVIETPRLDKALSAVEAFIDEPGVRSTLRNLRHKGTPASLAGKIDALLARHPAPKLPIKKKRAAKKATTKKRARART